MKILFDQTQKERGQIHDNFEKLASLLENEGHKVALMESYPIKHSVISNADVLVFLCPDSSKLYGHEIKALLRFVDEGGALAIFSNAGGDNGLNTNLNSLLKHFNMEIVSNQIFDYQHFDLELESNPIVNKFFTHPITEGIGEITLVSSCSLYIESEVQELARTTNQSDPPSSTVMALTTYGLGSVFVCGSYLMFSDKKAGIELRDNRKLAANIFNNIGIPPMGVEEEEEEIEVEEDEVEEEMEEAEDIIKPLSKVEIVKEALRREETDTVKQDIIKAISSLKDEVREAKQPAKEEIAPKMRREDIYQAIAIIEELEKEISELNIDDQGYKDILLTDMARRKGIDYTQILPYLEKIRDKDKSRKKPEEDLAEIVDIPKIPAPPYPSVKEESGEELNWLDEQLRSESIPQTQDMSRLKQPQQAMDTAAIVEAINGIKNSVDVLSANLIHLISEILLELKEQRKKRR